MVLDWLARFDQVNLTGSAGDVHDQESDNQP
jgi:hypothetical protein